MGPSNPKTVGGVEVPWAREWDQVVKDLHVWPAEAWTRVRWM